MLKSQKGWSEIRNAIAKWIRQNNAVDVIVFGSFAREKTEAGDIDLCIVVRDEQEKKAIDLVDSLHELLKTYGQSFHISHLLEKSFFLGGNMLAKTMLVEGISISKKKPVSELLGFSPKSIFIYSLRGFSRSKRVRFHYLLQGRGDSKGILSEMDGRIIGDGVISVPVGREDSFKEILFAWGVEFDIKRVLEG
ncbi:MAG: nucleotidyltransferase domain-containing protein [Candidatus Woesearchaeota archaeon]